MRTHSSNIIIYANPYEKLYSKARIWYKIVLLYWLKKSIGLHYVDGVNNKFWVCIFRSSTSENVWCLSKIIVVSPLVRFYRWLFCSIQHPARIVKACLTHTRTDYVRLSKLHVSYGHIFQSVSNLHNNCRFVIGMLIVDIKTCKPRELRTSGLGWFVQVRTLIEILKSEKKLKIPALVFVFLDTINLITIDILCFNKLCNCATWMNHFYWTKAEAGGYYYQSPVYLLTALMLLIKCDIPLIGWRKYFPSLFWDLRLS